MHGQLSNTKQYQKVGLNNKCPHCYKLYTSKDDIWWNHCPKGHRTLHLESIKKEHIQANLIYDYQAWIPHYKKHHHWIKRIFNDRRKIFKKVLKRDQRNIFHLYPLEINDMIKKATDIGDQEHRQNKQKVE